jgi:tellurite resistance protein TerC
MGTPLLWIVFNAFVLGAIALDLGVARRRHHQAGMREAIVSSVVWIVLAVLFGFGILHYAGQQKALEYFTGYIVEKSLSVDNLFLFLVIFRTFGIDERGQHRLLHWGILGALIMRGAMIAAGAALIQRFSWVMYVFGALLLYAGIHLLLAKGKQVQPEKNALVRFASRHLRMTRNYHGERFFVREDKKLYATPLFLVLLVIEVTDVTMAIDSVPAVFGITRDPFIVYTSNVFAILGLRALYFLLAGVLNRLHYLTVGLSLVLLFIGAKMIAEPYLHIPDHVSLAVVAGLLLLALLASLLFPPRTKRERGDRAAR